jgi:hypothetical protein
METTHNEITMEELEAAYGSDIIDHDDFLRMLEFWCDSEEWNHS